MNPTPPSTTPPPSAARPRLGLAVASLVLGILGFLSSFLIVGCVFSLIGLILGIAHLARRQGRNGMAWAGISLSVVGLAVSAVVGMISFNYFTSPEFKEVMADIKSAAEAANRSGFEEWQGVAAPDFSVTTLDGNTIKLSELKGKRVVLDFWATWCPPCVREIPHFIKLRAETKADELVIVGISGEEAGTLSSFVKKNGINYPIAAADNLPVPYKNVTGIPTTFFIDRKGVIQEVLVGYHDFDVLKAHALADDFAGEPQTAPVAVEPNP